MLGNTGPARHARAGFLEGEAIGTSLLIDHATPLSWLEE